MLHDPSKPSAPDALACRHRAVHGSAWLLLAAAAFGMLFPVMLLRGMSLDGVTYATIARNMALDVGDFWHPYYTATLLNPFYEQPPLALWLESLLFRMCGDQWWVERLYSALTVVPTALALALIWRTLFARHPRLQRFAWLSIALWVLMPGWFWIYRHNYLENTLGIFTALGVLASLKAMQLQRWWPAWTLLAAAAIVAALGSKGPVGLFPLATPALAWVTLREVSFRPAVLVQGALIAALAVMVGIVCLDPQAREFLTAYYQRQVLDSLHGQREMVDSVLGHFYLVWSLLVHLWPSATVAGVLVLIGRRWGAAASGYSRRPAMFCLATALSASVPIMISPKQTGYYSAPSWPFYTMALAAWCLPAAMALADRWAAAASIELVARRLRLAVSAALLLTVGLSPVWFGRTQRDAQLIRDVQGIGRIVGDHHTIVLPTSMERQWSLHAYLYRWHYISLGADEGSALYRLELANGLQPDDDGWIEADTRLELYRLYRRQQVAAAAASVR